MTKVKRINGEEFERKRLLKQMFNRQWINGDMDKYMQSIKRRVKEQYNIELVFSHKDEFCDELMKYKFIQIVPKS